MPEHLPPTGSESFHPAVDPAELVSAPDEHPEAAQSIAALVEDDHEPVVVVPPAPRNAHDLTPGERKLIGEGAKDRKQLQEIFDPLSIAGAQHLKAMLEANPAECRERIRDRPFALAPYGEVYIKLPPGFFGDQPPAVPAGVGTDEARRLATAFIDRITREGTAEEKRFFQLTPDDYRRDDTINLLTNRMNQLQYDGEVIYPDQWRQYEDTYQSFKDRNKEGDMFMVYLNRTFNTHRRYSAATGRNKDFVLTSTDTEYHTMPYGVIITPVGDYGPEFARDLGRTTAYAIEVLDRAVQDDAQQIAQQHMSFLQLHTARANDQGAATPMEDGNLKGYAPKAAVHEGVLSIMQTITMLTCNKVEGYDDPNKLMHDLIEQGMIERITRMVPMGMVGPLAMVGHYFPNPLIVEPGGRLALRPEVEAEIRERHIAYMKTVLAKKGQPGYPHGGLGLTCPVSGKDGGIRQLSEQMDAIQQLSTSGQ